MGSRLKILKAGIKILGTRGFNTQVCGTVLRTKEIRDLSRKLRFFRDKVTVPCPAQNAFTRIDKKKREFTEIHDYVQTSELSAIFELFLYPN